jgi:AhpD family alkylhydroperoxidase
MPHVYVENGDTRVRFVATSLLHFNRQDDGFRFLNRLVLVRNLLTIETASRNAFACGVIKQHQAAGKAASTSGAFRKCSLGGFPMNARLDYVKLAPDATRALYSLGAYLTKSGLEHALLELVKIRASQINGCAYCIDMHTKDARAAGETEQRIYALSAWRETPFFSNRERAALAWTEHVTRISDGISDSLFEEVKAEFSEKELVDLTWALAAINAWNRIAISFRSVPGEYKPKSSAV